MKLAYHSETDSLYIDLAQRPSVESREISEGVVLDCDGEGNLVGIDIDNASRKVQLRELIVSGLQAPVERRAGRHDHLKFWCTGARPKSPRGVACRARASGILLHGGDDALEVGLDLHQRYITACVLNERGEVVEWDAAKARSNLRKHGVSFDEATTVFADQHAYPSHSRAEERLLVLGRSHRGRLLLVAYAERGAGTRLISARRASPSERRRYEAIQIR
jgi:uncharacterized DUF497 family protein/uncharacterized protein YuzE